jgi:RimJ/RimL family protein N-acetyltransferase
MSFVPSKKIETIFMNFSIQPVLENDFILLLPLQAEDFEDLYAVASDPNIWVQHPNKDRWRKEVFQVFFEGAMQSKGAFKIIDKTTGEIAGSTRIYDYNDSDRCILIGYTFFATKYWGTRMNHAVKKMMLDYLFQYVDQVHFHIGAENLRSQISITRLGARKTDEVEVAYYGEPVKRNFVYSICKEEWNKRDGSHLL